MLFLRVSLDNPIRVPPFLLDQYTPTRVTAIALDRRAFRILCLRSPLRVYVMFQSLHLGNMHLSVKSICERLKAVSEHV